MNMPLEKYKMTRFIQRSGQNYTFSSFKKNKFNEPEAVDSTVAIRGVYHENHEYLVQTASDSGGVTTKLNPQIMCLTESTKELKPGMVVEILGKRYELVAIRDVNNFGLVCDISLEMMLDA